MIYNKNISDLITSAVEKYSDAIFSFVNKIIDDRDQAKDITQETFVKILTGMSRINDITRLRSYLYKTAYHLSLNYKRDERKRIDKNEILKREILSKSIDMLRSIEENEYKELLINCIGKLPQKQKQALLLRFYSDLKIKEIANTMSVNESTVKVHLCRGLKKLKKQLNDKRISYEL